VYNLATVRARARALAAIKPIDQRYYAIKANSHPAILELLEQEGFGLECVSHGELRRVFDTLPELSPRRVLFTPSFAPKAEYEAAFALGVNGSFVARSIDTEAQHLSEVLRRAAKHKGTAFMEVYQNCNVFNDGAFDSFREKDVKAERTVRVEHGKPLLFGTGNDKGLRLNPKNMQLEVVQVGAGGVSVDDVLVHDEGNSTLAFMLARMPFPEFPVALGVLFAEERPTYDGTVV
jgi:hypothetical protein